MRVQRDFNTNGSHGAPKGPTLVAYGPPPLPTATPAEIAILPVLGQTEAVRGGSWCVGKVISPVNPSRMRVQRDVNTNGSHGVPESPTLVAAWAVLLSHFET